MHTALGREEAFLEYYRDNRRQQLASDLVPPANFAEAYPAFIARVQPSGVCKLADLLLMLACDPPYVDAA